jgi:GNAT superfamily N-acetyltransferase
VAIEIRMGDAADVDAAASVYERSNLAYREGVWPGQAARVEQVRARLRDAATWFLLAQDGPSVVGMASAGPLRGEGGAGPAIPGGCFVSYLYVSPERWGEGIGGLVLDAVLAEAKRRGASRIHLWTQEDNERSHRLYRSRGLAPTGRVARGEGEWTLERF